MRYHHRLSATFQSIQVHEERPLQEVVVENLDLVQAARGRVSKNVNSLHTIDEEMLKVGFFGMN